MNILFPSELFYHLKAYLTLQGDTIFTVPFSFKSFDMDLTLVWNVAGLVTDKPINKYDVIFLLSEAIGVQFQRYFLISLH